MLAELLLPSSIKVHAAEGTYFLLVDYSNCERLAGLSDVNAAERLLEEAGVASIPLSPFYREPPRQSLLRLCFAKREETLRQAASRILAFEAPVGFREQAPACKPHPDGAGVGGSCGKTGATLRAGRRQAGATDVVVLPEMFTTGFSMEPERLAEEAPVIVMHGCWGSPVGSTRPLPAAS